MSKESDALLEELALLALALESGLSKTREDCVQTLQMFLDRLCKCHNVVKVD